MKKVRYWPLLLPSKTSDQKDRLKRTIDQLSRLLLPEVHDFSLPGRQIDGWSFTSWVTVPVQ